MFITLFRPPEKKGRGGDGRGGEGWGGGCGYNITDLLTMTKCHFTVVAERSTRRGRTPPPLLPAAPPLGGGCGHGRGLPSVKTRFKYVSAEREPQEVLADVYKKAAARAGRKGDRSEEERGGE